MVRKKPASAGFLLAAENAPNAFRCFENSSSNRLIARPNTSYLQNIG
jgi:hypothetical protein